MTAATAPSGGASRLEIVTAAASITAVTIAIYFSALGAGFVGDDFMILHRLRALAQPADVLRFFRGEFFEYYRPLPFVAFAIDWSISGADPRYFHLTRRAGDRLRRRWITGWLSARPAGTPAGLARECAARGAQSRLPLVRDRQLFALTPALELALVAGSFAALAIRRNAADRIVGPLAIAVCVCAAIVLNNASTLYFIHVLPALLVPLGALFTHGISGPGRVAVGDVRPMAVVVSLVCIAAVCAGSTANAVRTIAVLGKPAVIPQEVASLRARVDRRCKLAANGALYVPYLADYTYFTACATPR